MLAAKGSYCFICDVDLSMPITEIPRFLPPQMEGADIVIASREAPGSIRYNEPYYRHFSSDAFSILWCAGWPFRNFRIRNVDLCFKANAVETLFPLVTIPGWTFDVEVLAIAYQRGYRVQELPIPWYYHPHSKVKVVRDSIRMALDLIEIRQKLRQGSYERQV